MSVGQSSPKIFNNLGLDLCMATDHKIYKRGKNYTLEFNLMHTTMNKHKPLQKKKHI